MRNLTVKRTKSFVGCLMKMKLYIEDPLFPETTINGVPCRKLGTLKNGEEKTFEIEEQAAKVYVVADSLSRGFCNDFYEIPDGAEDIFLSGQNKFNPATGNAFRFDNNDNPEAATNRKKGVRKGVVVLVIAFIVGIVFGIGSVIVEEFFEKVTPKDFSVDGLTVTLTEEFRRYDMTQKYDATYGSRDVSVFVLKEEFSPAEGLGDYTLEEYAALLMEVNGRSDATLKQENGLTYFTYDNLGNDTSTVYRYVTYVYKAGDTFWMVQFAVEIDLYEEYAEKIAVWASSVTFED